MDCGRLQASSHHQRESRCQVIATAAREGVRRNVAAVTLLPARPSLRGQKTSEAAAVDAAAAS